MAALADRAAVAAAASAATAAEPDTLNEILELGILRDEAKAELLEILESFRGRKCLVIDVQLRGLFSQINNEGSKFLKENGVQYLRELTGEQTGDLVADIGKDTPENIVYLVRPSIFAMKLIAAQVKGVVRNGVKSQIHVCFVPSQSTVCLHLLEDQIGSREVWDKMSFGEFRLGLIPFDTDLLSLEMDSVFKQCYVEGDLSSLNTVAAALLKLQSMFGVIPNIKSKGLGAKKVLQKLFRMRVEEESGGGQSASSGSGDSKKHVLRSQIDTMVILDREIDLISPLVTPLTYEGLVDSIWGIANGRIKVDQSVVGEEKEDPLSKEGGAAAAAVPKASKVVVDKDGKVSVVLNNNDAVFKEIRDLSVEKLGLYLQEKAIQIRERYTSFRGNKDASISEIHDFVKKIPKLTREFKSLNQHINIAELIKNKTDGRSFREQWQHERGMLEGENYLDDIEEQLYSDAEGTDMYRVLQLLCMQSLTAGGIRGGRYDSIRKSFSQTYGYQHLYTLSNLERAGLIRRNDNLLGSGSVWQSLRKLLRLIDANAGDISYVSAGYAPLLARLVQQLVQGSTGGVSGWTALADVLKLLPGPAIEITQLASVAEELSEAVVRSQNEMQQAAAMNAAIDGGSRAGAIGSVFAEEGRSLLNYTTAGMAGFMNVAGGGGDSAAAAAAENATAAAAAAAAAAAMDAGDREVSSSNPFADDADLNPFGAAEHAPEKKVMLIFVVGGLSYLEIAAFRHLSKNPKCPYKILMATTKLINGSTFLQSLDHNPA